MQMMQQIFGQTLTSETLPPRCPGGIYHEKQVAAMCAVHCVNNMLQGPLFEYSDFGQVAHELDAAERRLTGGHGLDYGNMRTDGFFNVQVMQAVLVRAGYNMQPLTGEAGMSAQIDTAKERAFILNKRQHWYALRRVGQEWFNLNSCLKTPRHYTDTDLRFHIGDAVKEGYMVFVVCGDFPRHALEEDARKLLETIQGCGGSPTINALREVRLAGLGGSSSGPEQASPSKGSAATSPEVQVVATYPAPTEIDMFSYFLAMGFLPGRVRSALEVSAGDSGMAAELLLAH